MIIVGTGIGMTNGATENRVVGGVGMTFGALVPLVLVLATVNREILRIMVESGRIPGILTVALLAIGRETGRGMVGIGRLIVVRLVTADTGIGCVVVVAVVTGCALVGNGGVCSVQLIIIVVNRKSGRLPSDGGVATGAIGRNGQRYVIRIQALVVIRCMATGTGSWSTGIAIGVTLVTTRGNVRPGQWKIGGIVVKRPRSITCRVASQAGRAVVGISADAIVLVIGLRVGMAGGTGKFSVIGRVGMALGTLIPLPLVLAAVNGEILPVVVKGRRRPGRFGMATRTISREMRCGVIGIGGLVVIVEVTGRAVGGCTGISGAVAFCAIDRLMCSF